MGFFKCYHDDSWCGDLVILYYKLLVIKAVHTLQIIFMCVVNRK